MPASSPSTPFADDRAPLTRRGAIAVLLLFAAIWFANLDYRRLVHPDEGRYAEIPREMALSGDWVTPHLNGIKYFEKPALQYWITAAAYRTLGVHPWTARLWPATAGFLCVMFIGYVGLRLGGPRQGLYSAAALGSCLWFVGNAHLLTLDTGLTFWMTLGLGSLLIAQRDAATPREQRNWMLLAWGALALAVLSKGLIGVVLPGGALVMYTLLTRDRTLWRRLHLIGGTLLLLAIAAPWFVIVSSRNPEFFQFFFIHEHFTRFLTDAARRVEPWWYFFPVFIVGILPWLLVFAWTAKRAWTSAPIARNGFCWPRFALVWAAFIFVFFSASGSKLPSYILPLFPALTLVIGWQLATVGDSLFWRLTVPAVVFAAVVWLLLLFGYDTFADRWRGPAQPLLPLLAYGVWIKWALGVAVAGGALALWAIRRERRTFAVLAIGFSTLLMTQLIVSGHDTLAESRSSAPLLARITAQHGPLRTDIPFYSVHMYDQTVPYYLGRTVIPVEHPDELAMGIASEPWRAIGKIDAWRGIWAAGGDAYAIIPPDDYELLRREGVPMHELGRDARRVIVSRH
ncbi:MAG: glycosyltransferase family 39 protein [Casimicrobiaceae bacterium]